jgi:hypothetical protein
LDKEPLNTISDNVIWADQRLTEAYLDQVYSEMMFLFSESDNDPVGVHLWGMHDQTTRSDESRHAYPWYPTFTRWGPGLLDQTGGFSEWWTYPTIRKTNEFLKQMESSPLPADVKAYLSARARWARAMCYFAMVKRYGGIPLITTAQAINESPDQLFVPRNKEVEVYDFIINEMDAIIPAMKSTDQGGYPTRWAAFALKSRAAMYAASIATWGEVQINGLVGIPATEAQRFWQASYNASDSIIKKGPFTLYNKYPDDKVKNFRQLFVDEAGNPESIYAMQFKGTDGVGVSNGWDMFTGPQAFVAWAGNSAAPYLEMIESFEHADGTPGTLDKAVIEQGLWDPADVFKDMEPRFFASIYTQGTPWHGSTCDNWTSLIKSDGGVITTGSFGGVNAQGSGNKDGGAITGFGIMKYLNEQNALPNNWNTETDWMVFRLGEILLNQAEAAIELSKPGEALQLVNQIRTRGGVASLGTIDRDKVRHERKIELAFEGNRLFDLRRWRTAVAAISRPFSALSYSLDYTTRKFKLKVVDHIDGGNQKLFLKREYYQPITAGRIANNAKLAPENPGY